MSSVSTNELAKLKQFIVDNNIVGTSAGVCVALAAKDGIQSLVGDIIIPIIIMLLHALHIESLSKFLPVNGSDKLNIPDFVKQMVTFILIIIISFVFVQFAFGYLLGIDSSNKDSSSTATDSALALVLLLKKNLAILVTILVVLVAVVLLVRIFKPILLVFSY